MKTHRELLNMKASSWLPHLTKLGLLCLLVLVLNTAKLTAAAENHFQYEGVVGGNVTFYCPVENPQKLQLLYFQKGNFFVNGYYIGKSVSSWPNTRLDRNQTTIHMYGLNLSHAGEYKCVFKYITSTEEPLSVSLHLLVTAPFSKPLITMTCEDNGCDVTCASHNGYPNQQITWQMEPDSSQMWNTEVRTNPTTKMLNVSSTGYINCTSGEVKVSCSVGNIISDVTSVCVPPTSTISSLKVIIAVCIILVVFMMIVIISAVIRHLKKRKTESPITLGTNDHPPEDIPLSGVEEAP